MAAFQTTRWRWISGFLGILCLLLMILLVVILLNKSLLEQGIKTPISPGLQESYSDCCSCLEGWIGYQCNCYFISIEEKSWKASRDFCESKNSSLLQLPSKSELGFMRYIRNYFWIGVLYDADQGAWIWQNGSEVSLNIVKELKTFNKLKCIVYKPSASFLDESCHTKMTFICKQQIKDYLVVKW